MNDIMKRLPVEHDDYVYLHIIRGKKWQATYKTWIINQLSGMQSSDAYAFFLHRFPQRNKMSKKKTLKSRFNDACDLLLCGYMSCATATRKENNYLKYYIKQLQNIKRRRLVWRSFGRTAYELE